MAPTATTHPGTATVPSKVTQPQDRSTVVEQLTDVARDVMAQAIDLLENTLTDGKQLTYQSKYIPGSTIGQSTVYDYDGLLSPIVELAVLDVTSAKSPNGQAPVTLSYDARIRDTPMETSITAGIEAFREAIKQLEDISKYAPEDLPVVLTADTGPYQQVLNTTYGRELWFGSLHAIHHWSMVRVIAGELGLTLDVNFGVAPSTINYHQNEGKSKI
ncbi:hypothetical protein FRC11_003347 [Ceratobasidium sp. 423]|nr:hypothetical protein FRC11_003347 [Ceratobasidium sp. 423]